MVKKNDYRQIVESGPPAGYANKVFIQDGGALDYYRIQQDSWLGKTDIYLGKKSRLRFFTFTLGGNLVRNDLNVEFTGENSKVELYGLYLTGSNQIVENNTFLHHPIPFCQSFQQYCGILFGKGKAVFNGRILVERRAQKTDAYQESKNILLGDQAQMLGKPFLEIFADDVKCTHGFAIWQIEPDEIFYLRSRGIDEKEAKKILLLAFSRKITDKINSGRLKNYLENLVKKKITMNTWSAV